MWHHASVLDVALVDCAELSHLDADRQVLLDALGRLGIRAEWWAWDDDRLDWTATRLAVVRSTWNYSRDVGAFLDWVDRAEAATALHNPPNVIRWNAHKSYLLELDRAGVPVVPTRLVPAGEWEAVAGLVAAAGWDEVVVKPAVGVGAEGAYRVPTAALAATVPPPDVDVLVQPFVPSIATDGETSVILLDGAPSHAVCKMPRDGDYRVQEQHGGRQDAVPPNAAQLEVAAQALNVVGGDLLYARVDLVDWQGTPHLMELELIEPSLFLGYELAAPDRFARAVAARLT